MRLVIHDDNDMSVGLTDPLAANSFGKRKDGNCYFGISKCIYYRFAFNILIHFRLTNMTFWSLWHKVFAVSMTFERAHIGYFLAFMVVGGLLGSALAVLLAKLFPALSIIKENLTAPVGFNLEVLAFSIKINAGTLAGMVAGILFFRKA